MMALQTGWIAVRGFATKGDQRLVIRASVSLRVECDPAREWLSGELCGFVSCNQLLKDAALDVVVVVRRDHDQRLAEWMHREPPQRQSREGSGLSCHHRRPDTYASQPKVSDDSDVELAQEVAAWVAVAVGNAESAARTSDNLTQLHTVMTSRACIEQAKGILMERHKITEDEAFTILTHASQRTNTKLRDVAAELVRTGTLPS